MIIKLWHWCGSSRRNAACSKGLLVSLSLVLAATLLAGCNGESGRVAEPDPVGGPAVMRRLTASQYRATVADIFGEDVPVVARFERAFRADGLIAIGTGAAGMSPFSVEQYDAAARSIAEAVLSEERREKSVPCAPVDTAAFDNNCAASFVTQYGTALFRRPLSNEEVAHYVGVAKQAGEQLGGFYQGLQYALTGLLVAPDFLLRIERVKDSADDDGIRQLDAYSKATKISYFLINSTPDAELLRAAGAGELESKQGLIKQVDRLIASAHFERAVRAFFEDMLQYDLFADLSKDPTIYPAFNSQVAADAQEQTLRTIVDHLIVQKADYRDLFTTRETFLTRPLGIVYRLPVPTRNGWEKTEYPEDSNRYGIQTNIDFLALHAHPGRSSPTLRGKAAREIFLCQIVPDPPANVDFSVVQDPSNTEMPTARERLSAHQTEPSCAGCHKITDPLGFTLENYDGLGAYRTTENNAVIDPSGSLDGIEFTDAKGFAYALRNHSETPRCLVEKMYRFSVGRDIVWDERAYMDYLISEFVNHNYRVPDLMRAIVLSKNFFVVAEPDTATAQALVTDQPSNNDVTEQHMAVIQEKQR